MSAPEKRSRFKIVLIGAAAANFFAMVGGLGFFRYKVASGVTPAARGEKVAQKMGCFGCHGMGGEGGVPNPGEEGQTVPAWTGGTAMMYILKPEELDEWVLDGGPKRLQGAEMGKMLLEMPAYRGKIGARDYADLRVYLRAVMGLDAPAAGDAKLGYEVAQRSGCFGCHGPSGRGLRGNPRSLAGYIPSWEGPVFDDLVKNDAELEEWIRDGSNERLRRNPVARHFMARQVVAMPAYGETLNDGEIRRLIAYVHWLRDRERDAK